MHCPRFGKGWIEPHQQACKQASHAPVATFGGSIAETLVTFMGFASRFGAINQGESAT